MANEAKFGAAATSCSIRKSSTPWPPDHPQKNSFKNVLQMQTKIGISIVDVCDPPHLVSMADPYHIIL